MKKTILVVLTVLLAYLSQAQTVRVYDMSTLQGIEGVHITHVLERVHLISDHAGKADITAMKNDQEICFQHVGYQTECYSWKEIEAMNFQVPLQEKSMTLDEAVISASRFEEKAEDIAQPVQVVDKKELEFMNQQTTADVMQNTGNIMVQKSQLGGGSPIIRGFETNKVLMVVDGVRMNNAIYRGGHLQNIITLDNTMMEKVEIVYGPGSVIYGSDALGGVMHFYSKNPVYSSGDKLLVTGSALTRYSTAYSEGTGHLDFSIGGKRFASLTSITFSSFGDLMQGNQRNPFYGDWGKRPWYVEQIDGKDSVINNANPNKQVGSAYSQMDVMQKFLFKQNERIEHGLNLQYSRSSDIDRYDRLTQTRNGNPRYGDWYYGPQERLLAAYHLKIKGNGKLYDEAKAILAYQFIEESRNTRPYQSSMLESRTETLNILTLNIDLAKKIGKQEIRYGLDAWYNDVKSVGLGTNILDGSTQEIDSRYPNGGSQMQSIAAYITHAWEISEKLILNDGIRWNMVGLSAKFLPNPVFTFPFDEAKQNNNALNGNIGLIYHPSKAWRFTINAATGFRAPNVDDLSKVFESVPGNLVVPNTEIKPEYTWNLDLGIRRSFSDKIAIGINGFYTHLNNAIILGDGSYNGQDSIFYDGQMSNVVTSQNAGKAYIYGFSAYLNADITRNFSIISSLNYTYGRIETDTTPYPLDHIPPLFGRTAFQLKLKKFRAEYVLMYSGAKESRDYNLLGEDNASNSADPVNGYMPAWLCMSIRTSYHFSKYLQMQVALENIMDQNYRVYASNISAPGRNLVLSLRGNF